MTYNTKRFKRGRNATRKYYGGQLAPTQDPQMDKKEFIKHKGIITELANKVVNLLKPVLKIGLTKALKTSPSIVSIISSPIKIFQSPLSSK
jgi:hypothetical protein